jgi:hypothetical protein
MCSCASAHSPDVQESDLVTLLPDGRKQWQLGANGEGVILKHPWEVAVETYYRSKRPHGAYTPYIDTITLVETSGSAGADFSIERLYSTPPVVPRWLFKAIQLISGTESKMSFLEKLKVRRSDGVMHGEFQMLSFARYAECVDVTTFERHPDNPEWTLVKVQATLRLSSSLFGLSAFFESLMIRAYAKNVREVCCQYSRAAVYVFFSDFAAQPCLHACTQGRSGEEAYAMSVANDMKDAEDGQIWIDTVPELTHPPTFYSVI